MSINKEQPPVETAKSLAEYLQRKFVDINVELQQPSKFPERKETPYKPQIGDVHYFGNPATHSYDAEITSEGFWGHTSTGWVKLHEAGIKGLGVWRYRTETATPPASGQIRFDNANISAATEFYLSETNDDGTDVSAFLELLLQNGSVLYVQDQSNADNHVIIEISGSTDNGTYRTYGIQSIIEEGTEPDQNQKVILVTTGTASSGGSISQYMYPIYAEENAVLGDATYEWAFGNGADTPSNNGIAIYVPSGWTATIVAMSATTNNASGTSVIEADINGTLQGANCNVTLAGRSATNDSFTPVSLSNGDRLTFRTTTAGINTAPSTACAWIKMVEA